MNTEMLSQYAAELYDALKNLLEEIPAIAVDSRYDVLALRIHEANRLIVEIAVKELSPCPFCGGRAELLDGEYANNFSSVRCTCCNARTGSYESNIEALRAWNRRMSE